MNAQYVGTAFQVNGTWYETSWAIVHAIEARLFGERTNAKIVQYMRDYPLAFVFGRQNNAVIFVSSPKLSAADRWAFTYDEPMTEFNTLEDAEAWKC
jgi:hypothetical protein